MQPIFERSSKIRLFPRISKDIRDLTFVESLSRLGRPQTSLGLLSLLGDFYPFVSVSLRGTSLKELREADIAQGAHRRPDPLCAVASWVPGPFFVCVKWLMEESISLMPLSARQCLMRSKGPKKRNSVLTGRLPDQPGLLS